jgi:23S rRNA (uracil1939-C5)-methyltransferase
MVKGKIDSIAFGGEGILCHEGLVIFVPFTAHQDEIEVEILSSIRSKASICFLKQPIWKPLCD